MTKRITKILLITGMLALVFFGYVEIVNWNSKSMNFRQKIMKAVYPVWMKFTGATGKNTDMLHNNKIQPPVSFYSLKTTAGDGTPFDFAQLKGKKVMLVNTASDCGYTPQYEDLQSLYQKNIDKLIIIAFPANDFKEQEKGTDAEIAEFCKVNFGVTFPLMKKSIVISQSGQNEVFQWLTDPKKNGWNEMQPSWNFSKYLVNEEGMLTDYFGPSLSPASKEIAEAVNR